MGFCCPIPLVIMSLVAKWVQEALLYVCDLLFPFCMDENKRTVQPSSYGNVISNSILLTTAEEKQHARISNTCQAKAFLSEWLFGNIFGWDLKKKSFAKYTMGKYGPSPLPVQTVISLLKLRLNTQENLLSGFIVSHNRHHFSFWNAHRNSERNSSYLHVWSLLPPSIFPQSSVSDA